MKDIIYTPYNDVAIVEDIIYNDIINLTYRPCFVDVLSELRIVCGPKFDSSLPQFRTTSNICKLVHTFQQETHLFHFL